MHALVAAARILVVEDSPDLVALLERVLGEHGYEVLAAHDGEAGLARALEQRPDLIILDIGLPRMDGLRVAGAMRREGISAPLLILTARTAVADRISGLDAGADDYLGKPFDADELLARVRALLRRAALRQRAERLQVGDLVLDPLTREACRGDRRLTLTPREFALLEYLMRSPGQPVTREAIVAQVWKQGAGDIETNIVDVYVAYLRRKLDVNEPPMLHTVRGTGYVLSVDPPATSHD